MKGSMSSTTNSAMALTAAPPATTRRSRALRRRSVAESQGEVFIGSGAHDRAIGRGEEANVVEIGRRGEQPQQLGGVGGEAFESPLGAGGIDRADGSAARQPLRKRQQDLQRIGTLGLDAPDGGRLPLEVGELSLECECRRGLSVQGLQIAVEAMFDAGPPAAGRQDREQQRNRAGYTRQRYRATPAARD